jgi:drug/metabolite transporter (DMT)-like permease
MDMNESALNNQEIPLSLVFFTGFLCILFGSNAVAIKLTLTGLGSFTTAGLRFCLASFTIYIWARITGRTINFRKGQLCQLLITSSLFTAQLGMLYLALTKTNASRATLLINIQPFFVLFLAHLFIPGDNITIKKLFGLILGFMGMGLVFFGKEGITSDIKIGDTMTVIAAFLWACNTTYSKRIINRFDPFLLVFYPMIFSIPFFFLAGFLWDGSMISDINLTVLGSLLYQSCISGSLGFVAWYNMLQKYGAVSLHSFLFIMPIAGVALGGLVLGEPINLNLVFSLILIVSGILLVNLRTRKSIPVYPSRGV